MIGANTFDIIIDVKAEGINNTNNLWRVKIPEKYHGNKLQGFVFEMESQFVYEVPYTGPSGPTLITLWPGMLTNPYASDSRRPYNDLRLRLQDIKNDCYNFNARPIGIIATSYGITQPVSSDYYLIAEYSLPDALYPIVFEVNNNEFSFQIETSNTEGDFLMRPSGPNIFMNDQKTVPWNCKYFVIKFRFIVVDN